MAADDLVKVAIIGGGAYLVWRFRDELGLTDFAKKLTKDKAKPDQPPPWERPGWYDIPPERPHRSPYEGTPLPGHEDDTEYIDPGGYGRPRDYQPHDPPQLSPQEEQAGLTDWGMLQLGAMAQVQLELMDDGQQLDVPWTRVPLITMPTPDSDTGFKWRQPTSSQLLDVANWVNQWVVEFAQSATQHPEAWKPPAMPALEAFARPIYVLRWLYTNPVMVRHFNAAEDEDRIYYTQMNDPDTPDPSPSPAREIYNHWIEWLRDIIDRMSGVSETYYQIPFRALLVDYEESVGQLIRDPVWPLRGRNILRRDVCALLDLGNCS